MLPVDPTLAASLLALVISIWSARSSARQATGAEQQAITARIQELETLYAARLADLKSKYHIVQHDCELFRRHAQRCEEDITQLRLSMNAHHTSGGSGNHGG